MKGVCVCAIAKMENRYIREWVDWYVNHLKADKIFLYDNNDVDGEIFEDVIKDYIDYGVVEVIDWRGNKDLQRQNKAYTECYNKHKEDFEWMGFFDIDEYLVLKPDVDLETYLQQERFRGIKMVHCVWQNFWDSGLIYDDGRGVMERFTYSKDEGRNFCKTLLRGGLTEEIKFNDPHTVNTVPNSNQYIKECCGLSGNKEASNYSTQSICDYSCGYLAHYPQKTIEEYLNYKLKRGYPDRNKVTIEGFFDNKERTKEKEEYIEKWKKENILK